MFKHPIMGTWNYYIRTPNMCKLWSAKSDAPSHSFSLFTAQVAWQIGQVVSRAQSMRIGINWESTIDLRNTRSTIVTIYIYTIQKKCKKELIFGYWKFLCWKCPTCSTISVGNSVDIFCHIFRPSERPIIRDVPGDAPRMCIPSSLH